MIKKIFKLILPKTLIVKIRNILQVMNLFKDYYYDFKRYYKYSATFLTKENNKLLGKIIAHYHVIEKGLSYQEIRLGFAKEIVKNLITLLKVYSDKNFDTNNNQYITAVSVVKKYIKLHESEAYDIDEIKIKFNGINLPITCNLVGGTIELTKKDIDNNRVSNFKEVALSRFSIRDFIAKEVDIEIIEEAIRISQKSPSVCNRQSSKVYIVSSKEEISKYLNYQNGNRGFGHKINKLLIVTSDLNLFHSVAERNQSFIDGGIFSMSLLYSLHYLGLGAVTLNWCTTSQQDLNFRKISKVNDNENIILMIGVGHIPEKVKVPRSERKELSEIVSYI